MSGAGDDSEMRMAPIAKPRSGAPNTPTPCALKLLAPDVLASAIIGKGGTVITEMRASSGAKIVLSEQGSFYPQTDSRVLTISAATEETLNEVSRQILAKIGELLKSGSPPEVLGHGDEMKIKTLMPRAAVGGFIGKGGAAIRQIRETSGANISISNPEGQGPAVEQVVALVGAEQALETVLMEVNRQIQILNAESWFQTWVSSAAVVPTGGPGRGGGAQGPAGGGGGGGYQAGQPGQMATYGFQGAQMGRGFHPQLDMMMQVSQSLPPYVMEDSRGFAMSCVVPNRLVGGIIGRGGAGTRDVQNMTGAKVSIREIENDPDNRSLNISGPLANTCAAYMLMMKRYLDSESQTQSNAGPRVGGE